MDEAVRLVCPDCDTAYRVKNLTLGKAYNCKKCGAPLLTMNPESLLCPDCGAASEPSHLDVSRRIYCSECTDRPALVLAGYGTVPETPDPTHDVIGANLAAVASVQENITPPAPKLPPPDPYAPPVSKPFSNAGDQNFMRQGESRALLDAELKRLAALSDTLAARLDLLREGEAAAAAAGVAEVEKKLGVLSEKLEHDLAAHADSFAERTKILEEQFAGLASRIDPESAKALSEQLRETGDLFLTRLEDYHSRQEGKFSELSGSLSLAATTGADGTILPPVLDIDGVADRVASSLGERLGAAAKTRDEEFARLDRLTGEIKRVAAVVEETSHRQDGLDRLPEMVADKVGRSVEDQVVGPVAKALARQAPEILAHVQDDKLVEIVSRAVREAQRPLLRELISGGRVVPLWLFASLLIPMLLILGYLFIPEILGIDTGAENRMIVAEEVAKLRTQGVPLAAEDSAAIHDIGTVVNNMYENAWAQVRNYGSLETEMKNLRKTLAERDQLIADYNASLQKQSRRIRAYEIQLTRLGISPDVIPDSDTE